MPKKKRYRIRNWKDYNKALVNRGSLTIWFDKNSLTNWYDNSKAGKRGRPTLYSDMAIECCLTIREVFDLPLRATQGFVDSLITIMRLSITAPDYSLLSVRQKKLQITLPKRRCDSDAMHIVVDSTGLKVFGEGEWKVKKHGKEKCRDWVKVHLAVDEKTSEIQACVATADNVHDCEVLPELLEQINVDIDQVTGDGAYDTHDCYLSTIDKGATACFPPRKNAVANKPTDEGHKARNRAVGQVRRHDLNYWKKKNNYHRRSLAETAMSRLKRLLGGNIKSTAQVRQAKEIAIKCVILNKMTALGMPCTEYC